MTKHPVDESTTLETDAFETIAGDDLSGANGGLWNWPRGGGWQFGQRYGQPQYYTVRPGDNLTNIAKGANQSLNHLLSNNPQYQANPNLIHPGERVLTGRTYPCYYI
jgi:hypothetical protein